MADQGEVRRRALRGDLFILAGTTAIEAWAAPSSAFVPRRIDDADGSERASPGPTPEQEELMLRVNGTVAARLDDHRPHLRQPRRADGDRTKADEEAEEIGTPSRAWR